MFWGHNIYRAPSPQPKAQLVYEAAGHFPQLVKECVCYSVIGSEAMHGYSSPAEISSTFGPYWLRSRVHTSSSCVPQVVENFSAPCVVLRGVERNSAPSPPPHPRKNKKQKARKTTHNDDMAPQNYLAIKLSPFASCTLASSSRKTGVGVGVGE